MKLWGDVPWEGGPRKVYLVVQEVEGVPFATLAYMGRPQERNLTHCGKVPAKRDDVLTMIRPEDLGTIVYGSGSSAEMREAARCRGYRIKWR